MAFTNNIIAIGLRGLLKMVYVHVWYLYILPVIYH